MTGFLDAGRHGLRNLLRFTGRDTRSQFWFWVLWLFIGYQLLGVVLGVAMVFSMGDLFVDPGAQQVVTSDTIAADHLFFFRLVLTSIIAVSVLVVSLLAAAMTRRLHDSDLRGWWGLLPLPFLLFGMGAMSVVFLSVMPSMRLFIAGFLNNLIYLVALIVLVILLCRPSTPGPNRFGERPVA